MQFNSALYLIFLVLVLVVYWTLARWDKYRVGFVLVASYIFYMAWNPLYLILIVSSTTWDFFIAKRIEASTNLRKRKLLLVSSLMFNLGILFVFKYANFFSATANNIANAWSLPLALPILNVLLPVGISFYTFQILSYTMDVYRGKYPAVKSFPAFAAFVSYFPQLVAGPIVRANQLVHQIQTKPQLTKEMVSRGLYFIASGMIKKIVIADYLAVNLVDRVFDAPMRFSSSEVMLALYSQSLQIYADFAGYCDIAIGSALLMGIVLPDNFNRPYKSRSIEEFWRRWHMTLGTWFRDYLYFPLGGSKHGENRTYLNLFIVFLAIGMWHGANWTFAVYGAIHASAMIVNRWNRKRREDGKWTLTGKWPDWLKVLCAFHFLVLARIIFRSPDFSTVNMIVKQLLQFSWGIGQVALPVALVLIGGYFLHWSPDNLKTKLIARFLGLPAYIQGLLLVVLGAVLMQIAQSQALPFAYFQF